VKTLKRLKPALNTGDVKPSKLQPSGSAIKQTIISQAPSLPAEIPMIKLGSNNPYAPMLATDENLQYALDKYPIFVLQGFARWCGYCRKMNGTFSELSGDLQGQAAFGLINAEKNNETKKEYNISAYPTILIFKNGKLVDRQSGYSTPWDLASRLKRLDPGLNISKVKPSSMSKPSSKQNVARTNSPLAPKKNCSDIKKEDSPQLQAFVVSYCPFGLQMQRLISEIIEKIPASSNNIKVRYIGDISKDNISSMHGQQEADENLVQICIREEQSDRYWMYVTCFAKSGSSYDCLNSSEIDGGMLKECTMQKNRGFKYAEHDFEIARKFGASGSPTLILNNETVSEFDFGGRTDEAVKTLLCCGFASKPNFCSQNLNTSKVATGFSMRKKAKPDFQPPTAKAA
jgi:thioredoxin 1